MDLVSTFHSLGRQRLFVTVGSSHMKVHEMFAPDAYLYAHNHYNNNIIMDAITVTVS